MNYNVLYRKWSPLTFNEVVGQEHVTTTLINSINLNQTSHAYLFTGPRGVGKTTMARVWAGWAHGQNWYRNKNYLNDGYKNPTEVLDKLWNKIYYHRDANDLIAMMRTWQEHDISNNDKFQKNISLALNSITAKSILMPGINDLYFPPEDNEIELKNIKNLNL